MTRTTTTKVSTSTVSKSLNINEASKACGLSPSVLRIWELRYGWPNPKRKANGYRTYSPHLVDDLKRMANLVKQGTPIRQLVIDGLPQWPNEEDGEPRARPRTIDRTRALPEPAGREERALRNELLAHIETLRPGPVIELLQRCAWQVRRHDELDTCLAPTVCGLAELVDIARPMPEPAAGQILQQIIGRCRQIDRLAMTASGERQHPPLAGSIAVAVDEQDLRARALGQIAVLALQRRGHHAFLREAGPACRTPILVDATSDRVFGDLTALAGKDRIDLAGLLHRHVPLAWLDQPAGN